MRGFQTFTAVLVACLVSSVRAQAPGAGQPNIVFIYADDWGWGDLSCHGHKVLKTPNIDRLADEGTDFQQFNVLNPVCSPSRTAALTGRYPSRFCINSVFNEKGNEPTMPDWLDPRAVTTPKLLKAAGYRTGHFGKWHLGSGALPDAPKMADYGIEESAVYNGPGPKVEDYHTIADLAADFITKHKAEPFYLNVWLHESHLAHQPTEASLEQWKHLPEQQRVYAAVITDGDNAVGKVLKAIDDAGVSQNTIVIFSSDNGPENTGGEKDKGEPGRWRNYYSVGETGGLRGRKRSLFEGGVRVPFIVRWPGHLPAGAKNETTVVTAVDLLPTLCAAAGVEVPAEAKIDGENLLGAFQGEQTARRRPVFWLHTGKDAEPDYWPRLAVRQGDWKLLTTYDGSRAELYNVPKDRAEAEDVASFNPEVVKRMKAMALDWYATLPKEPDPACVSKERSAGAEKPKKGMAKKGEATGREPDRIRAFARWDTDKDGVLSLPEYQTGLKGKSDLESRLRRFDKDGDGKVTRAEFTGE